MLDREKMATIAAWAGLPAGLALSSVLGNAVGHMAAAPLWRMLSKLPMVNPSAEGVAGFTIAAATAAAPLVLMPVVRTLQRDGTLPSWASAPVGMAVAGAGVGHFVGAVKPLLMAGAAMPVVISQIGLAPAIVAAASCVAGLIVSGAPSRKGKKVKRDPHGPWQADWLPMREARKIMSHRDGLILGEACVPSDEPHKVGISPLLRMKPKGHILSAAGSGAGKGISVVVPNCLGWGGPLVVHDPAAETLPIVRAHREGMGRIVRVVSLGADTDGVNVLEWLDPEAKTFTADVRTVVSWLDHGENGGDGGDESFNGLAKTLTTCLIMFVLTSPDIPEHDRHLLKVRQLGASPNLAELLRTITGMKGVARGAMANAAGMVLRTMQSEETFAGVSMHFDKLTSCLEGMEEILCGMVSDEKRFGLRDILVGDTDFFICLPPTLLASQPQVPRILLGALASCFLNNPARVEHDTLFVVDEMPRLGRMEILSTSRDIARKYALYVWAIVQDLGQVEEYYKKTGVRSWIASPAILQFFGVSDLETAEMLSKRCGDYTAIQESESKSKGRTTTSGSGSSSNTTSQNAQGTRVALIAPDEIMSLAVDKDGVPEEQLLILRGRRPLRCGLPKYFRRKEMAGLVKDNPYYRPPKGKLRAISSQQAVAAVYGAVLAVVATVTAASPLPLAPGDEVTTIARAELFSPDTGRSMGNAVNPGVAAIVVGMERPDHFVEVRFPTAQEMRALVSVEALEVVE